MTMWIWFMSHSEKEQIAYLETLKCSITNSLWKGWLMAGAALQFVWWDLCHSLISFSSSHSPKLSLFHSVQFSLILEKHPNKAVSANQRDMVWVSELHWTTWGLSLPGGWSPKSLAWHFRWLINLLHLLRPSALLTPYIPVTLEALLLNMPPSLRTSMLCFCHYSAWDVFSQMPSVLLGIS